MIPILYYGNETSFTSNGVGRLSDIIECVATEERNGIYEVEFTYPITGQYYKKMVSMVEAYSVGKYSQSGIIACIHDDHHDIQPFDIYSVSSPIDGIATFNAHHISYRLSGMILLPFEATSCADAFLQIPLKIINSSPFTFWTDKATSGSFSIDKYENVRSILGGEEGSILDVFGSGEYKFDKFDVKLYQNRGTNSGVTIRYGLNLMDITREIDSSGHYNSVAPYWEGDVTEEGESESTHYIIGIPEHYITTSSLTNVDPVIAVVDFSQDFEDPPTVSELRTRTNYYLANNTPWKPDDNIKISFVQLWQTTEYENVALLQRLSLCDQVSVYYEALGVTATEQEIIKVVYNVLLERYDEMELGNPQTSLSSSINSSIQADFEKEFERVKKESITNSMLQAAIAHATELITGGLGGHVIMNLNADGEPQEILIMDTDDPLTAVNVIRMNQNGIGFSTNGYNGPFSTAWTIDGSFNAAFITTGTLLANIIHGGTLSLGGSNNGNGVMRVYDNNGVEIAYVDMTGFGHMSSTHYEDRSNALTYAGYEFDGGEETSYRNPTTYSTLDWYKRKVTYGSGGVNFFLIQTNNSSGPIALPMEQKVGSIFPTVAKGLGLNGYNGISIMSLARGNSSDRSLLIVGNRFAYANLPSGESATGQVAVDAPYGLVLERETGLRFYTSTTGLTVNKRVCEVFRGSQGGLEIEVRPQTKSRYSNPYSNFTFSGDGTLICDALQVNWNKQRVVQTKDYGRRGLYSYETPTPYFGDIGDAQIDETGVCYVFIDPIFEQTISTDQYQVFLQKYGNGDCWVSERNTGYFLVNGTPGLKFGWELKAKQSGFEYLRINEEPKPRERFDFRDYVNDYSIVSADYIKELEEERMRVE